MGLQKFIESREGKRYEVYLDSLGKPTDGCRFEVLPSVPTNDTYMFGIALNVDARL